MSDLEDKRLQALTMLKLLDTPPSESFDRITRMASRLFDLPIAAVSLTAEHRQWFKSRVGVDHWEIPRDGAPCSEVTKTTALVVIPDLALDACYHDSLLARSGIRFYAGAPLVTREGFGLGAMCVLGHEPRDITPDEMASLTDLAALVMGQIELQHAFGRIEPVSGLPNRHQFIDDLAQQARDRPGDLRSVILLEAADPLRLREVLRVLGPDAVDTLVREATRALLEALGTKTNVYQVGATQFAWCISHADPISRDAALIALRLEIEAYVGSRVLPYLASPVVGIVPFSLGAEPAETLLRTAHGAAQDARNLDAMVSIYSASVDEAHRRRFGLATDMRTALKTEDQLSLVYQPRIDLQSGACVGAEALLRWRHPGLGFISPAEFIPIIEQTDLARPLTDWVIGRTIRQMQAWREAGMNVPVSVNVSVANLEEPDFAPRLIHALLISRLPLGAIEIEVTESALIRDGTRVGQQLQDLRSAGIKVAIDDFGTGYSSLSYLQTLPADIVKIDQSFIRNLAGNDRGRILVGAMVTMARNLSFRVVAEGVEDQEACEILRSVGCDEAQGYLISRPVPPEAFVAWLGDYTASLQEAA